MSSPDIDGTTASREAAAVPGKDWKRCATTCMTCQPLAPEHSFIDTQDHLKRAQRSVDHLQDLLACMRPSTLHCIPFLDMEIT